MRTLKEKIKARENTYGTLLHMGDVCVSDILSRVGFDFIWIDFEHSYLSYEQLLTHITVAKKNGTAVIVRVPQHDLTATKKILEMGVDGIIFPMVQSAKEAEELMKFTLYPPYGNRGFGPMAAIGYGTKDAYQYATKDHLDICRFIQIENKNIIDELDQVMKNEYIDGYIFGPNDLSGDIHEFLQVYDEGTTSLMQKAITKLKAKGKSIGVATGATDPQVIKHWHDMGIDMMTAGIDYGYLLSGAQQMLHIMQTEHAEG